MVRQQQKLLSQQPYRLDQSGSFIIENYNHQKTFSNFFPGVAGLWGIPMWVFYVNRGQCISSFGIEGKDKSILEFYPANKAYQLTSLHGFRTFLKIQKGRRSFYWEPFQNNLFQSPFRTRQTMSISAHDLTIEDVNASLGLAVRVNYFTLCEESFPALIRQVTVTNFSKNDLTLQIIDGLPIILPYGVTDWVAKHMSRTVEAWVKVRGVENKTPFYQLNAEVADTPQVQHIHQGHFYFSLKPGVGRARLLDIIVERQCVFGHSSDLRLPEQFVQKPDFTMPQDQQTQNRTPSALTHQSLRLKAGASQLMISCCGYVAHESELSGIVRRVSAKGYIQRKEQENQALIASIKNYALTKSASPAFDRYCGQTFLDNILRGGLPITLPTKTGDAVFNIFSRKHGDLERDYNYFVLAPTPYSQGNGNYRDVNQNRRNDVWFNVQVRDNHIIDFLNLMQADGYNPLVVSGMSLVIDKPKVVDRLMKAAVKGTHTGLREKLLQGFQPGELLAFVKEQKVPLRFSLRKFMQQVLAVSRKQQLATHGEGFWTDHWAYSLDLIESYLSIYPEDEYDLLFNRKVFSFYLNSHYVLTRQQRYIKADGHIRQYHSVAEDKEKIRAQERDYKLRTRNGEGQVYQTSLIAKLLCLIVNKAATLDPEGMGIEMEADKPNWYDALNGLPGLLGSSLNETIELKRHCQFLLQAFDRLRIDNAARIETFEELVDFIRELIPILLEETKPLSYWHKANDIKEHYRARIRTGIAGEELRITVGEIKEFLSLIIERVDIAVKKARDRDGILTSYFYYDVTAYETLSSGVERPASIQPKKFRCHRLPPFLEGFVHALRVENDPHKAFEISRILEGSDLYDRKLKMYKNNADLSQESLSIGRTCIFPRGWLENESIWLHMQYKYLLELLRNGLYPAFFELFKNCLIPFQDPRRYGRSILENSSFLVSSAHPDPSLHGRGFVARLSGSTAEFVHIWLWMSIGRQPFAWSPEKGLSLTFRPILPGWLFTETKSSISILTRGGERRSMPLSAGTYAFHFLGWILTVYHNPKRADTFPDRPIQSVVLTYSGRGRSIRINGPTIPSPFAQDVRRGKVQRIDVYFQ